MSWFTLTAPNALTAFEANRVEMQMTWESMWNNHVWFTAYYEGYK